MNTLATIRTANRLFGDLAPKLTAKLARPILMTPHVPRAREWELGVLAEAQPITFRFGLAGLRWGSHGPIVLLVHGWEGRGSQLAAMVPLLVEAGFSVVTFDAPGHGEAVFPVDVVVAKACAKDPEHRFASALGIASAPQIHDDTADTRADRGDDRRAHCGLHAAPQADLFATVSTPGESSDATAASPLLDELAQLDADDMSPREAHAKLAELIEAARKR